MAVVAFMQHHYSEAAELIESIPEKVRTVPNVPASGINPFARGSYNFTLGLARRAQGDNEKAQAAFRRRRKDFANGYAVILRSRMRLVC